MNWTLFRTLDDMLLQESLLEVMKTWVKVFAAEKEGDGHVIEEVFEEEGEDNCEVVDVQSSVLNGGAEVLSDFHDQVLTDSVEIQLDPWRSSGSADHVGVRFYQGAASRRQTEENQAQNPEGFPGERSSL